MKKITFTFFLLISIDAYALPNCPGSPATGKVLNWDNCFGTYTWSNGHKYVGEWKDDVRTGIGTYTWSDGDKYVGEWKDNKHHGQGTYTYADGRRDAGFYLNGEYIPDICKDMGLSINSSGYEKCINRLIEEVLN